MAISLCLTPAMALADDVSLGATVYTNYVNLEDKVVSPTAPWVIPYTPEIGAVLKYNNSGTTFEWALDAKGLVDGNYALIYYADFSTRFDDWGGDNPGAVIATNLAASGGIISTWGVLDLGMNLPCYPDANMAEYYYGTDPQVLGWTGDNYATGYGAKIWLIPTSALTGGTNLPVVAWPPTASWLFETDLISYTDTDAIVSITVDPTSIDFGRVAVGETAIGADLTVTNTGIPAFVAASVSSGIFSAMTLDNQTLPTSYTLLKGEAEVLTPKLIIPPTSVGSKSGTLAFIATPAAVTP